MAFMDEFGIRPWEMDLLSVQQFEFLCGVVDHRRGDLSE